MIKLSQTYPYKHTLELHSSTEHLHVRNFFSGLPDTFTHVQLFATPWTIAHQAPLPMGFPRQEY